MAVWGEVAASAGSAAVGEPGRQPEAVRNSLRELKRVVEYEHDRYSG